MEQVLFSPFQSFQRGYDRATDRQNALAQYTGQPIYEPEPLTYGNALAGTGTVAETPALSYGDGEIAQGIRDTAARLGMDPLDLATIISYETAGTFDPTKAGPTTKWGQHRGLIQFGEPQAEQYGVDWSDPVNSQLGAGGAVENYFTASGWRPGMGMLDAYSIVNAGGPGRYNASDTAAGGAPGTVRDKVEQQMDGHRRNAARLLGMG